MQKLADISLFESLGNARSLHSLMVFNKGNGKNGENGENGGNAAKYKAVPSVLHGELYGNKSNRYLEKALRREKNKAGSNFREMNVKTSARALRMLLEESGKEVAQQTGAVAKAVGKLERVADHVNKFWDLVKGNNRFLTEGAISGAQNSLLQGWADLLDGDPEHGREPVLGEATRKLGELWDRLQTLRAVSRRRGEDVQKLTRKFLGMRLGGKKEMDWGQDYFGFDMYPTEDIRPDNVGQLLKMLHSASGGRNGNTAVPVSVPSPLPMPNVAKEAVDKVFSDNDDDLYKPGDVSVNEDPSASADDGSVELERIPDDRLKALLEGTETETAKYRVDEVIDSELGKPYVLTLGDGTQYFVTRKDYDQIRANRKEREGGEEGGAEEAPAEQG